MLRQIQEGEHAPQRRRAMTRTGRGRKMPTWRTPTLTCAPQRSKRIAAFALVDGLHVFLIAVGDMQTVWFPVPVAALFRRIVNVVSTLSISHQYLSQSRADPSDPHPPYSRRWSSWLANTSRLDPRRILYVDSHTTYSDLTVDRAQVDSPPPLNPSTSSSSPPDQIHQLIEHPALYDPLRKPRYPIVLCHGKQTTPMSCCRR